MKVQPQIQRNHSRVALRLFQPVLASPVIMLICGFAPKFGPAPKLQAGYK
jgi:hypothetical protein